MKLTLFLPLRSNFRKGVLTPHQIGNSQALTRTYMVLKLALNIPHPVMPQLNLMRKVVTQPVTRKMVVRWKATHTVSRKASF